MKTLLRALLLSTALIAGPALADHQGHSPAAAVQVGELTVSGAFARATLPRAPVGGAYMTITNHGAAGDRLLSVTAPVGKEVQIHEMAHADGVMTMRQLPDGLPIGSGESVTLSPSGTHLMLMGLTERLVEGERLDLVLHFGKAGDVTVGFDILALNARGPAGAASGHDQGAADHGMDHGADHGGHAGHEHHGHDQAAPGFDQAAIKGDEARIVALLKNMFETPEAPLAVAPVLIDGDLAVIGWSQSEAGGRALLRRDEAGLWQVSLCAGDGLKGAENMVALGVEAEAAARLAAAQAEAEAALPPEQVASFALFDDVLHVEAEAEH